MEKKKLDAISLGELLIDFTPGNEVHSYIRNPGGAPANVAVAFSRMGKRAGFIGTVGKDDFGAFLIETMRDNDVEMITDEPVENAITTMAFVGLVDGERTFTFARKPGADMMLSTDDIKDEDLLRTKLLNAGSCTLSGTPCSEATTWAIKRAHELGIKVSFDVNYRDVFWKNAEEAVSAVKSILPYVDYLKLSDEEIELFGGEDSTKKMLEEFDIELLVLTYGAGGSKVISKSGLDVKHIGFVAEKVVDTTGAGDSFWGTFLSMILDSGSLEEKTLYNALEFGNAAGALSVKTKGAITSIPTKEEVNAFLTNNR